MYINIGYYSELGVEKFYQGADGKTRMVEIMKRLRTDPPAQIGDLKVTELRDVQSGKIIRDGKETGTIDLPAQNLLFFILEDNSWIAVRPSGTEPKIKSYIGVIEKTDKDHYTETARKKGKLLNLLKSEALKLLE